ncbi:MAG: hypothetical protein ACKOZX_01140 [Gammaproteobacteria bacterium]
MTDSGAQTLRDWRFFMIRDGLLLVLACAAVWGMVWTGSSAPVPSIAAGGLVGLAAYLLHEWAHLLGALAVRARVYRPARGWSPFLFSFDSGANSLRQFLAMSLPGFAATALYVWAFVEWLPRATLWGETAWRVGLALSLLTLVVEVPIAVWAVWRRRVPAVEIPLVGPHPLVDRLLGGLRVRQRSER